MEGNLNYYKSKHEYVTLKCAIRLNDKTVFEKNEMIIYESDQKIKHKIIFKDIKKLSKLSDSSWEIITRSGLKYRFKALTEYENKIWYELLSDKAVFLNHFSNEQFETYIALSDQRKVEIPTNTFKIQVDLKKSNPNFLNVFEDKVTYELQIDELGYLFKNDTKKDIFLNAGIIKRFGIVDNYFLIDLGRNLDYGPGLIFVKSIHLNYIEIHKKIHQLTKAKFSYLFQKVLQSIRASKLDLNEEDLPCVLPIHVQKNKSNDQPLAMPQDSIHHLFSNRNSRMMHEKKSANMFLPNEKIGINNMILNNFSQIDENQVNISMNQDLRKDELNEIESESDNSYSSDETNLSFYKDKHKPKLLNSQESEPKYFMDEGDTYTKVKL